MRIISFTGPRGSGKDTCADILKEEGVTQGKISFAGPMKAMMCEIYGLNPLRFEDRDLKEYPFETPLAFTLRELELLLLRMDEYVDYCVEQGFNVINKFNKTEFRTPREMLQYVGSEIIRTHLDPAWHVKAAFSPKGLEGLDPDGTYSVTDARFPNEYQWLANRFMLDFKGFYVNRPEAETILSTATHMSELAVKDVRDLMKPEQILDNSGTLASLKEQLLRKAL